MALTLGLLAENRIAAQTFTTLYNFTNGIDGANPLTGLIVSGNVLYGTTYHQGLDNDGTGTVFKMNTDGSGLTTLHSFTLADGAGPQAGLILSGTTLYGTTSGGSSGNGTVFAVSTDGSVFSDLHTFTGRTDGGHPYGDLVLSGNVLYGTTAFGGSNSEGVVFTINTQGTVFNVIHNFPAGGGDNPKTGLIVAGNTIYGTTSQGGSGGGIIFRVGIDGTGFTNLHTFASSDGVGPQADLILSGNTLYGTANSGGSFSQGTVFKLNADGTSFTVLHNFTSLSGGLTDETNKDGASPLGNLLLSGNTLYGTTQEGGTGSRGVVFAVNTDGTGFTNLHNFSALVNTTFGPNADGANPYAGLILSSNTLFGTAEAGGSSAFGTVYSLSLPAPIQLTMVRSKNNLILTWPTNAVGYTLQSSTNLGSTNWNVVSPAPVTVNGQNTITNSMTSARMFFRLSK